MAHAIDLSSTEFDVLLSGNVQPGKEHTNTWIQCNDMHRLLGIEAANTRDDGILLVNGSLLHSLLVWNANVPVIRTFVLENYLHLVVVLAIWSLGDVIFCLSLENIFQNDQILSSR